MNNRILVWGAGAIGGTIGASLIQAGQEVTFVDVMTDHVEAISDPKRGLRIAGPVATLTVSAPAFLPDALEGTWDQIFLAVKAQDTETACMRLLPHLSPEGYVLSLQNGLCEDLIAGIVGPERTMGAFVNFGADWIGPGEILYGNRGAVAVGEIDGSITARVRALHETIRLFEPDAVLTNDIGSYLWGKLAYGSLLFAQAVGNLGIADCLAREDLFQLWRNLAGEVLSVARAKGIKPVGFNGFDPDAFYPGASEENARRSVQAMVNFNRQNAKTHSGVWRDLAIRKRRTEVDMQLVPIAAEAHAQGLPCPKLNGLITMIHEIENGKRELSDHNLNELAHD